jgi:hypothetical protein
MPAIVDLKHAVTVSAVADDVASRIAVGATGFLSRDRREKFGIQPVTARRRRDLRGEGHPAGSQARGGWIDVHGRLLSRARSV